MIVAFQRLYGSVVAQSVDDLEKIDEAIDTTSATTAEIVAAIAIAILSWPVSSVVARVARRLSRRVPNTPDYVPELVGRTTRWMIVLVAAAWSMSLLGVDVGWFALVVALIAVVLFLMLRPLIENLAAGLLLQSRPSFGVGDQIQTNGYVGEVTLINARSTVLQTRDNKRIHIPNQDVLDNSIDVLTAFERRRSSIELGIAYDVDPDHAEQVLVAAVTAVEGVWDDPEPYVLARGFGDGTTLLQVRWWHDPDLRSENRTRDRVVRAIKRGLDDAGIDMPSPEVKLAGGASIEIEETKQ